MTAQEIIVLVELYGEDKYREGRAPDAEIAQDYRQPADKRFELIKRALREKAGRQKNLSTQIAKAICPQD